MSRTLNTDGITEKQARFVQEYLKDLNASQAAKRAGYSAPYERRGYEVLKNPKVAALIKAEQAKIREEAGIEAKDVVRQVAAIVFADPRKLVDSRGVPLPLHKLDDATAAAVASYEVETNAQTKVRTTKVKFWDKNSAAEKLMKHLGLFEKDNRQRADPLAELVQMLHERGSRLPVRR